MRSQPEEFRDALIAWLRKQGLWIDECGFYTRKEWTVDREETAATDADLIMTIDSSDLFMPLNYAVGGQTYEALNAFAGRHGYYFEPWNHWIIGFYPLQQG